MKRIVSLVLASLMVLSLVGCGAGAGGNVKSFEEARTIDQYNKPAEELTYKDIDVVKFGTYPQSDENGNKNEPIFWIPIGKDENERLLYLMSKDVLDSGVYMSQDKYEYYSKTEIGSFLNNTFYNIAFSEDEKNIMEKISDSNRDEYIISSGYPLNYSNVRRFTELMKAKPTKYAKRMVNIDNREYTIGIKNGFTWWWNSSQGASRNDKMTVFNPEGISEGEEAYIYNGIRPFICVRY